MGSPMKGIQDNNSDHFPYFLKMSVAFWSRYLLIGNHDFFKKKFIK